MRTYSCSVVASLINFQSPLVDMLGSPAPLQCETEKNSAIGTTVGYMYTVIGSYDALTQIDSLQARELADLCWKRCQASKTCNKNSQSQHASLARP